MSKKPCTAHVGIMVGGTMQCRHCGVQVKACGCWGEDDDPKPHCRHCNGTGWVAVVNHTIEEQAP